MRRSVCVDAQAGLPAFVDRKTPKTCFLTLSPSHDIVVVQVVHVYLLISLQIPYSKHTTMN